MVLQVTDHHFKAWNQSVGLGGSRSIEESYRLARSAPSVALIAVND